MTRRARGAHSAREAGEAGEARQAGAGRGGGGRAQHGGEAAAGRRGGARQLPQRPRTALSARELAVQRVLQRVAREAAVLPVQKRVRAQRRELLQLAGGFGSRRVLNDKRVGNELEIKLETLKTKGTVDALCPI